MARSLGRMTGEGINKLKNKKESKKRPGNNLYGSKGKPKCNACRVARRGCVFKSTDDKCENCVRKGLKCGEKTRRGGAQDTVRITVLEQLSIDHPNWTLPDVIAHLHGNDALKCGFSREGTPDSDFTESSLPTPCPKSAEDFNIMELVHGGNNGPLELEFITPDRTAFFRRELTTLTSQHSSPLLVDNANIQYPITIPGTPQWPTVQPTSTQSQFKPNDFAAALFPSFPLSMLESEWSQLPQGPLGDFGLDPLPFS